MEYVGRKLIVLIEEHKEDIDCGESVSGGRGFPYQLRRESAYCLLL